MTRTWEAKSGGAALVALDERHRGARPAVTPEVRPEVRPEDESETEEAPPRLICRRCQTPISGEDAVFSVTEGGAVQVFPNPGGWMRKIMTVRWAENLVPVGAPTTDFTWFAGYAWTATVCSGCGIHLGWVYEAVEPADLARFHGLLVSEVGRG